MNWWWFAGVVAYAAGTAAAVWLIRRALARHVRAPRDVLRWGAVYGAAAGCLPALTGVILMWREPYLAVWDFLTAGFCLAIAGWYAGRVFRLPRGSAGREPAPTDRD